MLIVSKAVSILLLNQAHALAVERFNRLEDFAGRWVIMSVLEAAPPMTKVGRDDEEVGILEEVGLSLIHI